MDLISLARASFELTQLVKRLSRTYDELESRIDLMDAVSKQALIISRISKSRVPDEMQYSCAIIENKCTTISSELQEWKGYFKVEGKNKKPSSFKGSYLKIKAQTRLPELAEDLNDMALHANNLLLMVNMESMAFMASSREDSNKKVDNVFEIVSRPPMDLGLPREPGKYVTIDDGLNPIFQLPPSLCKTPKRLQRTLAIIFEKMPGLAQIERGHFIAYHWNTNRLICASEWPAIIKEGYGIRIAFVMGTWLGQSRNKCIRCLKPMNARPRITKGELRNCKSCNLQFSRFEPLDFHYKPQDVSFDFGGYHRYKQESYRKSSISPSPTLAVGDASPKARDLKRNIASTEPTPIDLVCRRLVIKWDPIFNISYRYLFCRCIAWASTPSQLVPEMTVPLAASCPRHNNKGISFPDYGNLDYSDDHYFDKFGGYGLFRLQVLQLFPYLYHILGGQAFMSDSDKATFMEKIDNVSDETLAAIRPALIEYHFERFDRLELVGTTFPSNVTQWLAEQRLERGKKMKTQIR
ncbi:unnamed protein product [Clonostachys solani]|uniref:Ubiquitin-like domain-containing protein n=1 Tax=Clonostachys solani TaxID=160281 RepID=A0A9N9W5C2_9HYPO|nr:unnamed protein product [Clonostachys solani]